MDDRIQRALDGDLARERLNAEELKELAAMETLINNLSGTIPVAEMPDLAGPVLARIEPRIAGAGDGASSGRWRQIGAWFWRVRPIAVRWRPAYAFGTTMVLVLFLAAGRLVSPVQTPSALEPARESGQVAGEVGREVWVQFRLEAPAAGAVSLAGDFTGWQPAYSLARSEPGVWTVVVPLEPGIHNYAFVVDGENWLPDPTLPAVDDGFGGLNSRVSVLEPDSGRTL